MPRTIATDIIAETNELAQTSPFIWLVEIRQDATDAIRLAQYTANVDWPTGDANTYYAFPLTFDAVGESTDGENQTATVTLYDPRGDLSEALHDSNGLVDCVTMVRLVHSDHLDETSIFEYRFKIAACTRSAQDKTVTWTLGDMGVFGWDAPYLPMRRSSCIWRYGSKECGVDTSIPGQYQTCDGSLPACIERGNKEAALGQERKHPRRWGGCADIPLPRQ